MPATRLFVRILAANAFVFLTVPSLRAQVTNVDSTINIAVAPSPGSGHDYVKMLNETVNPANGSVSLRVEAPVPKQRGDVNFPYYIFGYDSGGVSLPQGSVVWSNSSASLTVSWKDSSILLNNATLTGLLPGAFVANTGIGQTLTGSSSLFTVVNPSTGTTATCNYISPYMFTDPFGVRHSMNLLWITRNGGGGDLGCNFYGIGASRVHDSDAQYQASLLPNSSTSVIADAHGRTNNSNYMPNVVGLEDTNGNCCGATASTSVTNNQITSISFPGQNSYSLTYETRTRNYSPGSVFLTAFSTQCSPLGGDHTGKAVVKTITLPNSQQYKFEYDPVYVLLNKVTYPTGAWVSYTWGVNPNSESLGLGSSRAHCEWQHDWPAIQKRIVSFDGVNQALEQDYSYTTIWGTGSLADQWVQKTTTVTTKDLLRPGQPTFQTVYTYSAINISDSSSYYQGQTPIEKSIIYKDWNGSVLETVTKNWNALSKPPLLLSQCVMPNNGLTAGIFYTYGSLNVVTDKKEYDYGTIASNACAQGASPPTATPTRETAIAYQSFSNTPIYPTGPSILDRPSSVKVYANGTNGTRVAESAYTYDLTPVTAVTPVALGHDETNYSPTYNNRGNATTLIRKCLESCADAVTTYTYDETGQALTMTDPCGNVACSDMTGTNHTTQYFYNDSYTVLSNGQNVPYTPSGNTNAYLTKVINPLGHTENFTYDFNNGQLTSSKDPNALSTTYIYNDSLARPTQTNSPDGGQTTMSYNDTAPSPTVTTLKKINPTQTLAMVGIMDGLGHVVQVQLTSDPQGTVFTDTTYDGLGRVYTISNPYRSGTDPTTSSGTTKYGYDALGRKLTETYPDNSVLTTAYCAGSTLVTDPTGKWRRSRTDGLGRLVEVDEPNSPTARVTSTGCPGTGEPIWVTSYTNDTLGNLTRVVQNSSHQRNFTYDPLSHLLISANPEVGTINYTYDVNGNVWTKRDARNITTTYQYDVVNRETMRTYSNGDPSVTYVYDNPAHCLALSACQNIGHRTGMTDAAGSEAWAFQVDKTNSRSVRVDQRVKAGIVNGYKTATYYFDYAGNLTKSFYPTGRIVNYTYDSANRPSTAVDGSYPAYNNGITYATGFKTSPGGTCLANVTCYTPQGTLYALSIGQTSSFTGLNLTHIYNNHLQPREFKASSTGGNAIDITYGFVDPVTSHNAGHVYSITNNLDTTRSQTFTYDQLNRISSALTTSTHATSPTHCWGETYSTDAWGNLQSIAATTNSNYTGCSQESGFTKTADGNNHLSGFSYDLSGNTQNDGVNSYTWDGESQLKSGGGVNYLYDGDGRRVAKVGSKLYWYGLSDEVLLETDAAANTQNEYIFFGGKRVAMLPAGGNPIYYVEDLLGTSRVTTTNTGVVCYDADFYPYGGERSYTNTCPQNNYKFEGKERDTETGNDNFGARYYSNRFGRWLSADWSSLPVPVPYANLTNPQTLNLYGMVADDPESFADLDGHCLPCAIEEAANSPAGQWLLDNTIGLAIAGGAAIYAESKGWFNKAADFIQANPYLTGPDPAVDLYNAFNATLNENTSDSKPGEVYVTEPQPGSGKEYVGRTTQGTDKRMQTRTDSRTGKATTVDTYKNTEEGQYKEQKAMDARGGKQNLDNKRNEVNPGRMKELDKKYGPPKTPQPPVTPAPVPKPCPNSTSTTGTC